MYSTSVSTKMTFGKDGPKVNRLDIDVDGYKENKRLHEMNNKYVRDIGKGKFRREANVNKYFDRDWRVPIWFNMYNDMKKRLGRWKNVKY